MKPKRMHMVHNMVVNYGLYKKLDIVVRLNIHALEEKLSVFIIETYKVYSLSNDSFPFR